MSDTNIIEEMRGCFQCPFTWGLEKYVTYGLIDNYKVTRHLESENERYEFKTFTNYITFCFDLCENNQTTEAMDAIEKYEKKAMKIFDFQQMSDYHAVFKHVLLSTKLCIMLYHKDYTVEDLMQIIKEIPSINETETLEKAALLGLKASVITLYEPRAKILLDYGRELVKLDPKQPEWHYFLGRTLLENRRYYEPESAPSDEEIEELEKSLEFYKSSTNYSLLGLSYADNVACMYKENKYKTPTGIVGQSYHQLAEKSVELLKAGSEVERASSLVQCAKGFIKLPQPYGNMEMAEKCLLRAHTLDPNESYTNHQLGLYYAKMKNFENAMKYSKLAAMKGVVLAQLDYIRYKMRVDTNFDFLKEIDDNIDRYEESKLAVMLCAKASYLMFIKRDIEEGIRLYVKAIETRHSDYFVKNSRLIFPLPQNNSQNRNKMVKFSVYQLLHYLLIRLKRDKSTMNINIEEIITLLNEKAPDELQTKYTPLYIQLVNAIIPPKNNNNY